MSAELAPRSRQWAEKRANKLNARRLNELPLFANSGLLEVIAPTVTTDEVVAWEHRRVTTQEAKEAEYERATTARITANRAAFLGAFGTALTEIEDARLATLFPLGSGARHLSYHADQWHNLCRANGLRPVDLPTLPYATHPQCYTADDYCRKVYGRK